MFGTVSLTPDANALSEYQTNIGWTAGAGIEGRFASWLPPNWTWKLEYLYVDLGSVDTVAPFPGGASPSTSVVGGLYIALHRNDQHFTDNIVRVGLNYQFH